MLTVTIHGSRELREVAERLRRAKSTIRRDLAQGLRQPTEDGERAAKRAIARLPIRGYRTGATDRFTADLPGGHIRRRIARVIEAKVVTAVGNPRAVIEVRSERLGNAKNLPWLLDTGRRFRHPLPGTRNAWAASSGAPWFYSAIDRGAYASAAAAVVEQTIQRIEDR